MKLMIKAVEIFKGLFFKSGEEFADKCLVEVSPFGLRHMVFFSFLTGGE